MKITAIPLLSVPLLLITGCATSFGRVAEAVNNAPEWYGERRAEIRGEGYPDIASLPTLDPQNLPGKTLSLAADEAAELFAIFRNNPRAEVSHAGAAEIEAVAAEIRAAFPAEEPPAQFLTEADITAIRNSFNVPRVTQDEF